MKDNPISESLVENFCLSMSKHPEVFLFLSEGQVYHTGSQIFYDSESGAFGKFSYDINEDNEDEDEPPIKDINYISTSVDDMEMLHKSYIKWLGWYLGEKNKKILDMSKEMLITENHEDI